MNQDESLEQSPLSNFSAFSVDERKLVINHDHDCLKILDSYGSLLFDLLHLGIAPETIADEVCITNDRDKKTVLTEIAALKTSLLERGYDPNLRDLHTPNREFRHPNHTLDDSIKHTSSLPNVVLHINYDCVELSASLLELLPRFEPGESPTEHCVEIFTQAVGPSHDKKSIAHTKEYLIFHNGEPFDTANSSIDAALKLLLLLRVIVAENQSLLCNVHAAGLTKDNMGILLPAKGGSGKTTLTAYLMHNGYKLINDDSVAISKDTRHMLPAPMCMSIKSGSWLTLAPYFPQLLASPIYTSEDRDIRYLQPQSHQIATFSAQCRVLVIPVFDERCAATLIEPVSRVEMFEHLFYSGCSIERPLNIKNLKNIFSWLDATTKVRITYKKLPEVAAAIDKLTNSQHL